MSGSRVIRALIAGCCLLAAAACGGSDPPRPTPSPLPPPPAGSSSGGLWSGALRWEPANGLPGGAIGVRALVAETGEFRLVLYEDSWQDYFSDRNEQVFGTLRFGSHEVQTTGDAIWSTASTDGAASGQSWGNFGLAAALERGERISGDFQVHWTNSAERVGTLTMHFHSIYERPSSLEVLAGIFVAGTESLTIDGQGAIFYQSSDSGCAGNGAAEVIDPRFNMYRIEIEVDGCTGGRAIRNGLTFTGLANLGQNNDLGGGFINETLEMAVSATSTGGPSDDVVHLPWSLLAHRQ